MKCEKCGIKIGFWCSWLFKNHCSKCLNECYAPELEETKTGGNFYEISAQDWKNPKMRQIKIKLSPFFSRKEQLNGNIYFPIRVLKKNFNVKIVDSREEADIIFDILGRIGDYSFLKEKDKKIILLSLEDLFGKRNVFNLIESFAHKIFGWKKYNIMDKIDKILPPFISKFPVVYNFPRHLKFVKKISEGKIKNAYAIVINDFKGENIFILPSFLDPLYERMPKLIKKNNQNLKNRKKFCAFVVSSNASRERVHFFRKLSKYKRVDSYGKVYNNMGDQLFKKCWKSNINLYKDYKFVMGFENSFSKEYIAEKLLIPMFSGTIPIYKGASNIGDYFNTKAFINFDDCGSYEKMIKKIIELDKNDKKYLEMAKEPWFKDNKIPEIIKTKEKDLVKFYEKILKDI